MTAFQGRKLAGPSGRGDDKSAAISQKCFLPAEQLSKLGVGSAAGGDFATAYIGALMISTCPAKRAATG